MNKKNATNGSSAPRPSGMNSANADKTTHTSIKDKTDENYIFMDCILNLTNAILIKVQEMQKRLR